MQTEGKVSEKRKMFVPNDDISEQMSRLIVKQATVYVRDSKKIY